MMDALTHSRASVAPQSVGAIVASTLRPLVRRIDEEGFYPADVMHLLGKADAYRAHAGGAKSGDLVGAIDAMAEVGATCISTAFCMWCQDALVWYLANSENAAPRERYLDEVASGRQLGGTGLSNPMKALSGIEPVALQGKRVDGGYRITGRLPFVSNVENGHLFAGIFRVDDDPDRLAMAVFRAGEGNVALARNAHFIALEGSATYSVLIRDAFVPDDDVLSHEAKTFVANIRKGFVLLQTGFGIGAARGAARSMREDTIGRRLAEHLPLGPDAIDERCDALMERITTLANEPQPTDRAGFLEVLRVRLAVSWLALEAAQAAVLQFGARGYLAGAEAARRQREAQFVALVTPSIKHITAELAKG